MSIVVDSCSISTMIVCYIERLITLAYTWPLPAPASRSALNASIREVLYSYSGIDVDVPPGLITVAGI